MQLYETWVPAERMPVSESTRNMNMLSLYSKKKCKARQQQQQQQMEMHEQGTDSRSKQNHWGLDLSSFQEFLPPVDADSQPMRE